MKYYKIEGTIEMEDDMSLDELTNMFLLLVDGFGGGIKEVDEDGNDIINNQKTN